MGRRGLGFAGYMAAADEMLNMAGTCCLIEMDVVMEVCQCEVWGVQPQLINNGKPILLGCFTRALQRFEAAVSPLGLQPEGRSLEMEEAEEKEAEGKISSADPASCLPAMPVPLYWYKRDSGMEVHSFI